MDTYAAWLDRGVPGGAVYGRVLLRGVVRKIALDMFVRRLVYYLYGRQAHLQISIDTRFEGVSSLLGGLGARSRFYSWRVYANMPGESLGAAGWPMNALIRQSLDAIGAEYTGGERAWLAETK